jgi:uncharacterized SAM-dependent methyltransferase
MMNTSDFASAIYEQQRERERARLEAERKQDVKLSDDARKVLQVERMQKPEPIA